MHQQHPNPSPVGFRHAAIGAAMLSLSLLASQAAAQQPPLAPDSALAAPNAADQAQDMPFKSLFYTPEETAALHRAVAIYLKYRASAPGDNAEDFLKQLEGAETQAAKLEQNRTYTFPQFFLESLAYHSPDDWIIHINGQTISDKTPSKTSGSLRVVTIDKDKVSIEWKMDEPDMKKIKEDANKIPGKFVDVDYPDSAILFTLHTNQTFSTYAMQILEGQVRPVTIVNTTPANEPPAHHGIAGLNMNSLPVLLDAKPNIQKEDTRDSLPPAH